MVIEVLEGSSPTSDVLEGLHRLRKLGYHIALDDYDIRTESRELLGLADFVKVDIREHSPADLVASVRALREYPVRLVAEKIETGIELDLCRSLKFDLFQGYFLQKPEVVQTKCVPSSRLTALNLAIRLHDALGSVDAIERIVCRDVGFSSRILRYINSSYFGMPRPVSSMRDAIMLLGFGELNKLCWLTLLADLADRPNYLCILSLLRAHMCESLCRQAELVAGESYFMTGMLSMLDTLLGIPMSQVLTSLPLNGTVKDALLNRNGDLGAALRCVEDYERGAWSELRFRELDPGTITDCYLRAAEWADHAWRSFRGEA